MTFEEHDNGSETDYIKRHSHLRGKFQYGGYRSMNAQQLAMREHRAAHPPGRMDAYLESLIEQSTGQADTSEQKEAVDHPSHYNAGKFEVIDVIEDWQLGFNLGNTVKYLARAKHKGKEKEDLKKALWYLTRELEELERRKV